MRYLLLFCIAFQSHAQVSDFRTIDFKKADSLAASCNEYSLDNLPQLAFKLTLGLTTDVERFRAIYKWVCTNIANDYNLYHKNHRKRTNYKNDSAKLKIWNDRFKHEIFRKLRKRKKTICTGYAYMIQKLSELADLDCKIVHGFGRTSTINLESLDIPNHSWNAINLNDNWYLCDPTWASGIPNPENNVFVFEYNDGYFLANPELFAMNHFPLDKKWLLLDDVSSFETFLKRPVLYGNTYNYLYSHDSPAKMHHVVKRKDSLNFSYKLKKPVNVGDIYFLIDGGHVERKTKPTSSQMEGQLLYLTHQFKVTGFYDVHLYFRDDLIATYTVKVI